MNTHGNLAKHTSTSMLTPNPQTQMSGILNINVSSTHPEPAHPIDTNAAVCNTLKCQEHKSQCQLELEVTYGTHHNLVNRTVLLFAASIGACDLLHTLMITPT
jgi:hypothetical protein